MDALLTAPFYIVGAIALTIIAGTAWLMFKHRD